jgi:hypothetical protein
MTDERRRVRVRAPDQAQEVLPAALLVARELERGDEHGEEDLFAGRRPPDGLALDLLQQLDALLVHGIEPAREHRLEKLLLGPEVVVDRGEVHPGGGGEAAQARRLEPVLDEKPLRGIEDAGLGVG